MKRIIEHSILNDGAEIYRGKCRRICKENGSGFDCLPGSVMSEAEVDQEQKTNIVVSGISWL